VSGEVANDPDVVEAVKIALAAGVPREEIDRVFAQETEILDQLTPVILATRLGYLAESRHREPLPALHQWSSPPALRARDADERGNLAAGADSAELG
jgi:hypothetical protein